MAGPAIVALRRSAAWFIALNRREGSDRTQCPGCRVCPVVGAAGARLGACSASHMYPLCAPLTFASIGKTAAPVSVVSQVLGHSNASSALARRPRRERSLIEESRRRIFCPRLSLSAAPRAASSHRQRLVAAISPSTDPPSRHEGIRRVS